jgi:O-antigen/teichoic acid export membrane protein
LDKPLADSPKKSRPGKKKWSRKSIRVRFSGKAAGWSPATTFGGLLMWAVHKVATGCLSEADYGTLGMYLRALNLMMIPACGLQAVFAQQTAIALDPESRSRLSMLVRESVLWTFLLWGAAALGVWFFHTQIEGLLKSRGLFWRWRFWWGS